MAKRVVQVEAAVEALCALDLKRADELEEIGRAKNVLELLQPEIDALRSENREQDRRLQLTRKL